MGKIMGKFGKSPGLGQQNAKNTGFAGIFEDFGGKFNWETIWLEMGK
jgi:hypothetical protein